MDGNYAWEKLHVAVLALATGTGSLRDRLGDAYVSSLIRLRPEHHFPWLDLRQRFEDLKRIPEGIVGLYDRVARRIGE